MLEKITIRKDEVVEAKRVPTHFIFVLDNSGSMYGVIEDMKTDLKNKLSTMVEPDDVVSIITFSSSRDCQVVLKDWEVRNIALDIKNFQTAIDKHVSARGCTCFNEPLEEAKEIKTKSKYDNLPTSVLFLTDGYHNDGGSKKEVLQVVEDLSKVVDNFVVGEYGEYCDHKFLMEIIEKASENTVASHLYQENMRYFEPTIHAFIKNEVLSVKKVEVDIKNNKLPFVFYKDKRFNVVNGKAFVPEDVPYIVNYTWDISNDDTKNWEMLYSLIYHLASTRNIDELYKVLEKSGDKYVVNMVVNAFGTEFTKATEYIKEAITDESLRNVEWVEYGLVPDKNAYCVLDLIADLQDHEAELLVGSEDFEYKRISRKMVQASSVVTEEEKAMLKNSKDLENLQSLKYELKFTPTNKELPTSFDNLTWNSSRANLSVLATQYGSVDVSVVPNCPKGIKDIPVVRFRNFTLVQDGRKNMIKLPVRMKDYSWLNGKVPYETKGDYVVLDISKLPTLNRASVDSLSGKKFLDFVGFLEEIKAELKVANYLKKELEPDNTKSYAIIYGQEVADWLKTIGITDWGFAPKMLQDESTDSYVAQKLKIAVKGLSALPKVEDILDKQKNKIQVLMKECYDRLVHKDLESLESEIKMMKNRKNLIEMEISKIVFALIMSQKWFTDVAEWTATENWDYTITLSLQEEIVKI